VITSDEYEALSSGEQNELKWLFRMEQSSEKSPDTHPNSESTTTLDRYYSWWEIDKHTPILISTMLSIFFFPMQQGFKIHLSGHDLTSKLDLEQQEKWILLFMLGSFPLLMGRTIPDSIENSLKLCIERGGWTDWQTREPRRFSPQVFLMEYLLDPLARSLYYQ